METKYGREKKSRIDRYTKREKEIIERYLEREREIDKSSGAGQ